MGHSELPLQTHSTSTPAPRNPQLANATGSMNNPGQAVLPVQSLMSDVGSVWQTMLGAPEPESCDVPESISPPGGGTLPPRMAPAAHGGVRHVALAKGACF